MSAETFTQSLWYATAPPAPEMPALAADRRCDVAVVGAGIAGLSAALHLAERGAQVVVLEAREPGFGASGRAGGLVVPSFARLDPRAVERLLGPEHGGRLTRLVGGAAERVFALVRKHRIDCQAVQSGWLNPAHASAAVERLADRRAQWETAGQPVLLLDRDETARLTGSDRFFGALLHPTGGHLNPLAYVRGLARAALARGAAVHAATPVTGLARQGTAWRLATPRAALTADQVLLCTNALVDGLAPAVARSFVPLNVYQMATEPIDPERRRLILPGNQAVSDTRNNLFSYRFDATGRLVTGGMAVWQRGALERLKRPLAARLVAMLPALGPVRIDHAWHGVAALTPDFLPRLLDLGPGLMAVLACQGRGIALTTALGPALAAFAAEGRAQDLPVPLARPAPIRLHGLARHLPALLLPFGDWQDRLAW